MNRFLFIIVVAFLGGSAFAHDIHISYSKAELNGSDLHVKVSYYKDDFTKAVRNWYQGKADNFSGEQMKAAEFEYVKNYFRVWTDRDLKEQILPKLLNMTDDGSTIIVDLVFSSQNFRCLVIDEQVLFKEYGDQMNIFFIKSTSKEANFIFTPSKPTVIFTP